MNYLDVMNDEEIQKILEEINHHHGNRYYHGTPHVENVIHNLLKLTSALGIDKEEENYLCIACILHDLGQVEGSQNHTTRSREFAANYLKGKISDYWGDQILSAIEKHHEHKQVDKLSMFEHLALFADKMDFTYRRLDPDFEETENEEIMEHYITDVDVEITDSLVKLIIKIDNRITEADLLRWKYRSLVLQRLKEFAAKLKKNYKLEVLAQEERP